MGLWTGDEGEHWALYPIWRAVAGLDPHQLSTFLQLPVAVHSKAGLSADGLPGRTSAPLHPILGWIYSSPCPSWNPSPEHPCIALGCSYKKMKGSSRAWGWVWLDNGIGRGLGRLLQQCSWGLTRISWRLAVFDSIWDAFLSASHLRQAHMLASSAGP